MVAVQVEHSIALTPAGAPTVPNNDNVMIFVQGRSLVMDLMHAARYMMTV